MATTKQTEETGAFSAEEKAAMKQAAAEKKRAKAGKNTEQDVLDAIAAFDEPDKSIATKLHELMKRVAPELTPRTWYGFPAYARNGKVMVFYQFAGKFKARYGTIGFDDTAMLDDGTMWPAAYAITEWNAENEKKIEALIKKAIAE